MKGIYLETVDSTNDYIKRNADKFSHGDYLFTYSQTNGRGRRGRNWESDSKGIALSIFVNADSFPERISLAAANAVIRALKKQIRMPFEIKWPNDILLNGKKLCGILCENAKNGYIVGIGINISQTADDFSALSLPYATSVFIESGKTVSGEKIAKKIALSLTRQLKKQKEKVFKEYSKNCATLNKRIRVIAVDEEYEATALGLSENGGLIIQTDDGKTKTVISGEVSVRGIYGY